MAGKVLALIAVAAIAGVAYCLLIESAYPFVLASTEARASLEVTDAQRKELNEALWASNAIAFSIFGAVVCATVGTFVELAPKTTGHRLLTILLGCILGGIGGLAMGVIGHQYHESLESVIEDPMVHVFTRLATMFLPVAVAVGLTAVFASKQKADLVNGIVGAFLGGLLTAIVYGVSSGLLTRLEIVAAIMPGNSENRYLLFVTACLSIGVIAVWQISSTKRAVAAKTTSE